MSKVVLRSRPVLGNLTNTFQDYVGHPKKTDTRKIKHNGDENFITPINRRKSDLGQRKRRPPQHSDDSTSAAVLTEGEPFPPMARPAESNLLTWESCSSDAESLEHKRPRRGSAAKWQQRRHHYCQNTVSFPVCLLDGELTTGQKPDQPQFAHDIVRDAFSKHVRLEVMMDEFGRSDYALSHPHRSRFRVEEVSDYVFAILASERIRESKPCFVVTDFLAAGKQPNLTQNMLTSLADWVLELQEFFTLESESIHLAWVLLYAYLCHGQPLAQREIQLMACAAIIVANKFEYHTVPNMDRFVAVSGNCFTQDEFLDAEMRFLRGIDFAVHRPNPHFFLKRYSRVLDAESERVLCMSSFLLDVGMHSHYISLNCASLKAASALWLARTVLQNPSYREWHARDDVQHLFDMLSTNSAAQRFYSYLSKGKCSQSTSSNAQNKGGTLKQPGQSHPSKVNCCPSASGSQKDNTCSQQTPAKPLSAEPTVYPECDLPRFLNDTFPVGSSRRPVTGSISPSNEFNEPEGFPHRGSHSAPGSPMLPPPSMTGISPTDAVADIGPTLAADLESLCREEEQLRPLWPPILQHITGYTEAEVIPLAMVYHMRAMLLIAEAARGGKLAREETQQRLRRPGGKAMPPPLPAGCAASALEAALPMSPGGHDLRRQAVAKFCKWSLLEVADIYPDMAFENLLPKFPQLRCRQRCTCFVCTNLKWGK